MTRLEVEALAVRSAERVIAGPVSFVVETGRPMTILGETGAGKSLIAQAILGMLPRRLVASGRIALDGERIDALAPRARARLWGRRIALLPQEPWRALDPTMGALEQVEEGHRLVAGLAGDPARDAATAAFGRLGLAGAERRLPAALSGGMAQRVAFAAATAGGARLLLVDEPTKGLDAAARDSVIALLSSAMAAGAALLTITHDVALARALGGDAMILREGRVLESGSMEETLSRPRSPYGRELVAADPTMWPVRERRSGGAVALRGENLSVARGGRRLVERLDISLCAGERVAVTGPSGSGKSSLIDVLAGLLPPVEGRVIRREGVGPLGVQKLYQDPPAAFAARVNVGRSLRDLAVRHDLSFSGLLELLNRLAVSHDLLDRRPDAVSGGELQRLALARVLALRPAVILADEPTSRLDPVTQRRVMAVIGDAAAETGAAVALVTHNDEIARRWADHVVAVGRNDPRARDRDVA